MENIKWLLENSGPAIKLRMLNEGLINKNICDINELANELLQIEKIKTALTYFDQFKDFLSIPDRQLWGLVHNCYENCFEMFMPFFIHIGFGKGIKVFDEKIEIMRPVYQYLMETYAFHGLNIIMLLLETGYCFDDIEEYVIERIDKIHKIAAAQIFDIYETDVSKIRQSNKWKDKLILKDRHTENLGGEFPLPLGYDIMLLMRFYKYIKDDTVKQQVYDIMDYIMNPEYQEKIGGNYGWHWAKRENTYHAGSWGWTTPIYGGDNSESDIKWFSLGNMEKMSFPSMMAKSDYFKKCLNYLERYKTERGTYIFPQEYIGAVKYGGASVAPNLLLSQDVLSTLKRNDKKELMHEVYSTFFMAKMKNRIE